MTLLDEAEVPERSDEVAPRHPRWFLQGVAAATIGGLVLRVAYIWFERRGLPVWGDARYYHEGAKLFADGEGFIEPYLFLDSGIRVEAADHPPLYLLYLAAFSAVGLTQATVHMLASALLGAVTIAVSGFAAARLAGPRTGVIAATLVALYPNLWFYDGGLQAETMAQLWVAASVLFAYRFLERRTITDAALLGGAISLGAMSRAELAILVPAVLWPLAFRTVRDLDRRDRWRAAAAGTAVAGVIVAPWCIYNLTRFENPVLLSGGADVTLASASCDITYYGTFAGYWSQDCVRDILEREGLSPAEDRSVLAEAYRAGALDYIGDNADRLPVLTAIRVGRVLGVWKPAQQIQLDIFPEGREKWVAYSAAWSWYPLAALAVFGTRTLRRRGVVVYPLLALPGVVLFAVVVTFATTRYRAIAEGVVAILAAVAIDEILRRRRSTAEESP